MASNPSAQTVDSSIPKKSLLVVTDRDIVFNCPTCHGELVVDREGAGLEVPCSHCGRSLTVPAYQVRLNPAPTPQMAATTAPAAPASTVVSPAPMVTTPTPSVAAAPSSPEPAALPVSQRTFDHSTLSPEQLARRWSELKHQLKENRSQDTEMRGHVNRATIELHRLQLRLKTLQERHADIQAEQASLQVQLDQNVA